MNGGWNQFLAYRAFKGLLKLVVVHLPKSLVTAHREIDARTRQGLAEKAAAKQAAEAGTVARLEVTGAAPSAPPLVPLDPANLVVVCGRELADPVAKLSIRSGRFEMDIARS